MDIFDIIDNDDNGDESIIDAIPFLISYEEDDELYEGLADLVGQADIPLKGLN